MAPSDLGRPWALPYEYRPDSVDDTPVGVDPGSPPEILPVPRLLASQRWDAFVASGRQARVKPVTSRTGTHRGHAAVVITYRLAMNSGESGNVECDSQMAALRVPVECPETLITARRGAGRWRRYFSPRDPVLPPAFGRNFNVDTRNPEFVRHHFTSDVTAWLVAHPVVATLPLRFEGRWMASVMPSPPDPALARRQLDFLADVHARLWPGWR